MFTALCCKYLLNFAPVHVWRLFAGIKESHIDKYAKCIGLLARTPRNLKHEVDIIRTHWQSSSMIKHGAGMVISQLFGDEDFVAVHWRFEETKCRSVLDYLRVVDVKCNRYNHISPTPNVSIVSGVGALLPEDRGRRRDYDPKKISAEKNMEILGDVSKVARTNMLYHQVAIMALRKEAHFVVFLKRKNQPPERDCLKLKCIFETNRCSYSALASQNVFLK
eukprot:18706-Pyramimonas_sp.AAC.2